MGQSSFEKDRNRFSLSERLVVELFLLAYLFAFLIADPYSIMPYLWLLIAIVGGIISYILFYSREYSLGLGLAFTVGLMLILWLIGTPLMIILIFFVFVFWRVQVNFGGSRINGWPFFAANSAALIIFTLISRLFYVFENPTLIMRQLLFIYLCTSFLFYFIRMLSITVNSRQLGNFKVSEAGRIFGVIMGIGTSVFLVVLFVLKPVRTMFIEIFSFLFGGVFGIFGRALDPLLQPQEIIEENVEVEGEGSWDDWIPLDDPYKVFGKTSSIFEYTTLAVALVILIAVTIFIIIKKRNSRYLEKQEAYTFSFKGKKGKETKQHSLLYDYSSARDEVRKSFEQFEKDAQVSKFNRLHGETVKEWFTRMGWGQNDNILSVYNEVRYGSHVPTENEQNAFQQGLEEIKKRFFVKEV
ncbi:hypothetical protein [Sporosarcina highlanderae]|uniref:DUF4129 domain-containing protein n=1 Tax=Sporosarcina highlanderae TaxID=3035916 RepID=A0ABT8JS92_9BACL|nr:hypothetical protein [Sporosarcina highlanderae]MDN4607980.1 hypothetical protein [Sporosarcina highlanderae]